MHVIYMVTDIERLKNNNKPFYYIGSKCNWRGGKTYLGSVTSKQWKDYWRKATKNKDNFSFIVLKVVDDRTDVIKYEDDYIRRFNAVKSDLFFNKGYAIRLTNGEYNPMQPKPVMIDGVYYGSKKDAIESTPFSHTRLTATINKFGVNITSSDYYSLSAMSVEVDGIHYKNKQHVNEVLGNKSPYYPNPKPKKNRSVLKGYKHDKPFKWRQSVLVNINDKMIFRSRNDLKEWLGVGSKFFQARIGKIPFNEWCTYIPESLKSQSKGMSIEEFDNKVLKGSMEKSKKLLMFYS